MVKAVLFDLDGTIVNSLPLIEDTFNKVFNEMNLDSDIKKVRGLIGLPLKEIVGNFVEEDRISEFQELYQRHYRQNHDNHIELFPGILEILEKIEARYFLGIVTSKSRAGTEQTLEKLQIKEKFKAVVTAHDVERHKPLPDPVKKALIILETKPEDAVFVGDSSFDLISGRKAGVKTIAVTWGASETYELEKHNPDYLVGTVEELYNTILNMP